MNPPAVIDHIPLVQDRLPFVVDGLALAVHDVVVGQQLLADVEVHLLDLVLGGLDDLREHPGLDGLAILHAQPPHQIILH